MRSGPYVCVAGTAPIAQGGSTAAPGDVYAQSVRCLDIAEQALRIPEGTGGLPVEEERLRHGFASLDAQMGLRRLG
jgi:hypothetical protein